MPTIAFTGRSWDWRHDKAHSLCAGQAGVCMRVLGWTCKVGCPCLHAERQRAPALLVPAHGAHPLAPAVLPVCFRASPQWKHSYHTQVEDRPVPMPLHLVQRPVGEHRKHCLRKLRLPEAAHIRYPSQVHHVDIICGALLQPGLWVASLGITGAVEGGKTGQPSRCTSPRYQRQPPRPWIAKTGHQGTSIHGVTMAQTSPPALPRACTQTLLHVPPAGDSTSGWS